MDPLKLAISAPPVRPLLTPETRLQLWVRCLTIGGSILTPDGRTSPLKVEVVSVVVGRCSKDQPHIKLTASHLLAVEFCTIFDFGLISHQYFSHLNLMELNIPIS